MKVIKNVLTALITMIMCFSVFTAMTSVANAASSDEAVLEAADDRLVPLYTSSSDSSIKGYSTENTSTSRDYALFYTQTTLLALIAGYLILFKVKGIDHSEKMHSRRNRK